MRRSFQRLRGEPMRSYMARIYVSSARHARREFIQFAVTSFALSHIAVGTVVGAAAGLVIGAFNGDAGGGVAEGFGVGVALGFLIPLIAIGLVGRRDQ